MSLSSSVMHPPPALLFIREHSQEPHYPAKWLLAPCCLNSAPALLSQMILTVSTLQNTEEPESGSLSDPGLGNFIFPGLSRGASHSPDSDPVNSLFGLDERGYHIAEEPYFCENRLLLPHPRRLITKANTSKSARLHLKL